MFAIILFLKIGVLLDCLFLVAVSYVGGEELADDGSGKFRTLEEVRFGVLLLTILIPLMWPYIVYAVFFEKEQTE